MPDLKMLYQVVTEIEGTIQEPINFHVFESATVKADKIASESNFETDDVRVFELNLETLKAHECYVPSRETPEEPPEELPEGFL